MQRPPLTRSRDAGVLAGVCAGLAEHLGWPVAVVRGVMLGSCVFGGAGGLLYLWFWGTVPLSGDDGAVLPLRRALTRPAEGSTRSEQPAPAGVSSVAARGGGAASVRPAARARIAGHAGAAGSAGSAGFVGPLGSDGSAGPGSPLGSAGPSGEAVPRRRWPIAELLLGVCLLIAGVGLVLDRLGAHLELELLLPALAVLVGVGLTWWQIADRDRPDRNQLPRVLGALALVAVGVLMIFVTSREPNAWTVVAASLAVLAGVALAIAPWLLRINRELIAERAARAREAERSDIAAHLHDSVLQTLALIQQRSEPGSDVARIARGQERELREWLFRSADGAPPPPREAVDADLRAHATALEDGHSVRFEVVSVGGSAAAPEAIVLAAREAMLNAARHAGGDVTVYIEAAKHRVSIDVTDRGPGLDAERLPEGRMGVRESILGRMERAGGSARIVPGPGGGTSVRLAMPVEQPVADMTAQPAPGSGEQHVPGSAEDPAPGSGEQPPRSSVERPMAAPGEHDPRGSER